MAAFVTDLSKFAAKAKGNMDAVVRKVVLDVGISVVQKSPVGDGDYWKSPPPPGYVGGRFRGNWQYTFNAMLTAKEVDVIDPSGSMSIGRISKGLGEQATAMGIHYISNNLPYAKRLEEGWSYRQAPQGMVMLTAVEFQTFFRKAAAKL
jgi:hypothetical protein